MTPLKPAAFVLACTLALAASPDAAPDLGPGIAPTTRIPQRLIVTPSVREQPAAWSNEWPHIVSVRPRVPLTFNADATEIRFDLDGAPAVFTVETADASTQYADGTRVFVASDASVQGKKAKLESHPGNHRVGFWTDASDTVAWDFAATRWGRYTVELTYSLAAGQSDIAVAIGDAQAAGTIDATGSWYRYVTVPLGAVYLDTAGKKTLTVRCTKKTGGAVMNLKAVTLRPAPEGADWPLDPEPDGSVLLHSRDALVDGVTLRYEPKPEKNTLGYWSNPNDRAQWAFRVKPGEYDVEVLQGCGKGHGGSTVHLVFNGEEPIAFTVEDTGGWQNFKPRIVGRIAFDADTTTGLTIEPQDKKRAAVMDVRQVRLIPVTP